MLSLSSFTSLPKMKGKREPQTTFCEHSLTDQFVTEFNYRLQSLRRRRRLIKIINREKLLSTAALIGIF